MSARHFIRPSATRLPRTLLMLAALACAAAPRRSVAQSTTSLLPDATVLPSRVLRVRGLTAFTRYDELLGTGGGRNIGSLFAADSLGSAQVPAFAPSEVAIRDASGLTNFRLDAGRLTTAANSRVVTAPLILEYGLTSKLTLGVVVPLVETRTSLASALNPRLGFANVGPNGSAVVANNAAFVQSMNAAASALQARLAQCQASPSTCGFTAAQQSTAQTLVQSTSTLTGALARLYGTSAAAPGQILIPLDTSAVQLAIVSRVQGIRTQYAALLGADPITGTLSGANGPIANGQLQGLLTSLGHDTLQSIDRSSIGDITIGATYQFVNTFPDSGGTPGRHYRLAANGAFRVGTGQPANRNRFFDIGTGYGQPGVEAGIAADAQLRGNWSGSAIGSYVAQFGSVPINRVPNAANAIFPLDVATPGTYSAGNVMSLSLVPRYRLSGNYGITGRYSIVHVAADSYSPSSTAALSTTTGFGAAAGTAQQVGFGFTYATIVSPDRNPGRIPFEVAFTHLETISASGGPVAKTMTDQIELRVYFGR